MAIRKKTKIEIKKYIKKNKKKIDAYIKQIGNCDRKLCHCSQTN
jgi:hypothetical protein